MAAIITNIDPSTYETQNYSSQDTNLIPIEETNSIFNPFTNYVEYTIISSDGSFQITDQNFTDFKIIQDTSPAGSSILYTVDLDPEDNLLSRGFTNGEYNVIYNFLNNELNSSSDLRPFYIKEISSDRTELRIASNFFTNEEIESFVNGFIQKQNLNNYFQDFYLNFGNNNLIISNNILVDNTKPQYEILINLYDVLPNQLRVKDTLWVVTRVADPLAFNIQFQPEVIIPIITVPTIKGPNFDLSVKDRINNSTNYINYEELLTTGLATSQQQILSYLQDKSINISVDYSDFSDFIHFSSAQSRIENFYYKIQLIEQYNSDITTLQISTSSSILESVSILQSKVDNIINNFDGYEFWLYFETGSTTYPKGTTTPPYDILYSGTSQVITWYNNLIESASIYDQNNQDYLVNTIPDYLRDDSQNQPYITFINMIGQHYDNIWLYYKDVTNRYNGDNRLDYGISKDLVADALRSFGVKLYQNNFSTSDLYNAFIGYNTLFSASFSSSVNGNIYATSSYIVGYPEVGYFLDDITYYPGDPYEYIDNFITSSQEALFQPIDDVNKEIYKRIYHNLPLLLKQKGTVSGLRNLINIYGIPDTILRISEFGGRDKDISTYDYSYDRYNLALDTRGTDRIIAPWGSSSAEFGGTTPRSVMFRFKTDGIPPTSHASQSLLVWSDEAETATSIGRFNLKLRYTGSYFTSESYSGSIPSQSNEYGDLTFRYSNNDILNINAPFFNGGWWSIMIQTGSANSFYLYAKQNIYHGSDGNQLGYQFSASITNPGSGIWDNPIFTKTILGGTLTAAINQFPSNTLFSGSLQELRYYNTQISEEAFDNFVMNPTSIEGNNLTGSFLSLTFRAPLGNELRDRTGYIGDLAPINTNPVNGFLTSSHPAIDPSANILVTQSFTGGSSVYTASLNQIASSAYSGSRLKPNIETYYFDTPIVGLRNRMTNKIQIVNQDLPSINLQYTQSGNVLSQYKSIEQNYLISESITPDVNALEVAFSPQNEIDDDIIASLGYFNIGDYIGDPRQVSSPSTSYPDLTQLALEHFKKYSDVYDVFDYIRLIKFFDNSLFKMIKDFVPARTNLRSGVVVKQHLLERNKYPQPITSFTQHDYSGSIESGFIEGGTGGVLEPYNVLQEAGGFLSLEGDGITINTNFTDLLKADNGSGPVITATDAVFISGSINQIAVTKAFNTGVLFSLVLVNTSQTGVITFQINSDKRGTILEPTLNYNLSTATIYQLLTSNIDLFPGELIDIKIKTDATPETILTAIVKFGTISDNSIPTSQQIWTETIISPLGSIFEFNNKQYEFYNGEFSGSIIDPTNGELNDENTYKYPSTLEIEYDIIFYTSSVTPLEAFTNINTSPNQGELYLWYDTGSNLQIQPMIPSRQ